MKKLVSLLLTLALLCCSVMPAFAEGTAPVITVTEFKTAMNALAKNHLDWDLEWIDLDGIIGGNMANNPILVVNEAGYVTMAMVTFNAGSGDDLESVANLFIMISALVAAVPAVRDGMSIADAPDAIWAELQTLMGSLSDANPTAFGTLYGASAMVMLTEQDDGSIDMTLMVLYTDPTAE